jgi:hypothetical protein
VVEIVKVCAYMNSALFFVHGDGLETHEVYTMG